MHTEVMRKMLMLFLLSQLLSSCINQHKAEEIENSHVMLSLDEMVLYPVRLRDTITTYQYKYVVYVDSAECSPCKIAHMGIWNYFRNELSDMNAGLYLIFHPQKDMVQKMMETHDSYKHRIPIYIDTLDVFRRDNPSIAGKTTEYHSFLLNANNEVIVVGDASTNHHVRDTIFRLLSERSGITSSSVEP